MISVLSPSKDLDLKRPVIADSAQTPEFIKKSQDIVQVMKKKRCGFDEADEYQRKTSGENFRRYQQMQPEFNASISRPAIFYFQWRRLLYGLDAASLNIPQLDYLETHCRILSGLYGILRPFDLDTAYRLWDGNFCSRIPKKTFTLSGLIRLLLHWTHCSPNRSTPGLSILPHRSIFEVIDKKIKFPVIHIHFREIRNGKSVSCPTMPNEPEVLWPDIWLSTRSWHLEHIRDFDLENYRYDFKLSSYRILFCSNNITTYLTDAFYTNLYSITDWIWNPAVCIPNK